MKASGKYTTPGAFRVALEARLRQTATDEAIDLQRLRRMVAFDRFLARFIQEEQARWVLKGGYAMELRMKAARTTKDIDLAINGSPDLSKPDGLFNEALREELQEYAARDQGDYFVFFIGLPTMDINAAPYGGARFPVDARLDGRTFVKFRVDIGIGDAVLEPLETIIARDWLAFADIAPPRVPMLSKEQQFAEKLHAYTLPARETTNSRVKDMVDMALLIGSGELAPEKVRQAIEVTFARRKTHNFSDNLNPPPDQWQPVFKQLAGACGINDDIEKTFDLLKHYVAGLKIRLRQTADPAKAD